MLVEAGSTICSEFGMHTALGVFLVLAWFLIESAERKASC